MVRRVGLAAAVGAGNLDGPELSRAVVGELAQVAALQHLAAALLDLARGRFPHHARALARVLEALDQRLDHRPAGFRRALGQQRLLQRLDHRDAEVEPLDALRRPVGGNLVARHAPHLLGVGLEEDREQLLAELVAHPFVEIAGVLDRERLGVGERQHAGGAGEDAEVLQRLEGAQRIRVVLAAVVDARQARPRDEIVGQDLLPQVDDFLRLREEAMPADVEHEAVVFDRAADAAHVHRVLLDHDDRGVLLGEAVGGGEAGRPCADHEDVGMDAHRETFAKANRRWPL